MDWAQTMADLEDYANCAPVESSIGDGILFLLASTGISTVREISVLLGKVLGINPTSGTIKRAFASLCASKLTITQPLHLTGPAHIAAIRLSDAGAAYCTQIKLPSIQSEWKCLIDNHRGIDWEQHTACCLYFAFQARLRGYTVSLLPPVTSPNIQPDVKVTTPSGDPTWYVEVEIRARTKHDKWRRAWRNLGHIAICTPTPAQRHAIVREFHQAGVRRWYSTDISSLIQKSKTSDPGPLWLERW